MEPNFDKNPWEYEHGHEHGCHDMHHHGHDPYRGHWKPDHCHMHHHFGAPPCPPGMPKDVYERFVNKMARHLMKQEEYAKAGTALFDGIIDESIRVEAVASMVDTGRVLYSKKDRCFVFNVENRYYDDWRTRPAYNNEDYTIRTDKVYVYNGWMYHYDAAQKDLVKYLEVGGDDDRELLYKLDEAEREGIIDSACEKLLKNEQFVDDLYAKLKEMSGTDDALAEVALNNKIEVETAKAVERRMKSLKVDATIEYSESSSLKAEYDAEVNKIRFDLRLPFKELKQYHWGILKAVLQFEGIDTFPQDGGTFKYKAFVARTKQEIVNGELSDNVEYEIIDEAHVLVKMDDSAKEFVHVDYDNKEIRIDPNDTGSHREIVFWTDYGGNEGKPEHVKHVFEQCK